MRHIRFFSMSRGYLRSFSTTNLKCIVFDKPKAEVDPLRSLLRIETDDKLDEHIVKESERLRDYEVDGNSSNFRLELSNAHRNALRFQELLVTRSKGEIQLLSIAGLLLILEWARKLKLEKCRWDAFMHWFTQRQPWKKEQNTKVPLEIAMAAGAHSNDAWQDFAQIHFESTGQRPPFDYFVVACYERCNALRRAHADVRSTVRGSLEGMKATKALQIAENEVRSFISSGLQAMYDTNVEATTKAHKEVIETIIRSNLYFRSTFLAIRHLWANLLVHKSKCLSHDTYVFLISSCGTYNRQDTLVSTDVMMEQANTYWEKYVEGACRPLSLDIVFSVLMAYSSCNHPDTAKIAAALLELNLSSLYKKEILKCALHATAQQQDTSAFIALEEYCKANAEFIGDMRVILLRRRAHLLSHHPDEDILHFYYKTDSSYRDKYLTDIVFRWLEQRTSVAANLLHSIEIAEEINAKLEENRISKTCVQVESLMTLYAKASSKKGIDVYLSTPEDLLTQKSVIGALRILLAYGFTSKSDGQAKAIWANLPAGMYKLLSRDLASREVLIRFHPTDSDTDDLTRFWFGTAAFDPADCQVHTNNVNEPNDRHVLWDPLSLSVRVKSGLSCVPRESVRGGVWEWLR